MSVCRLLSQQGLTSTLVRDGPRLGMFTTTDLRDALLRDEPPATLAVRDVSQFELIEVDPDTELYEALWLMVRHRVHRLLVREGGTVLGVIGQLDLVSFVANHSHIVAVQIDEAASLADLKAAADRIDAMVTLLHEGGMRIERISRLVGALNQRLIERLWSLLAPPELVANSCLLVMGSEGRGEQILKTDQDNALLLRDGYEPPQLAEIAARFNDALAEFGYPPCPGGIMLTNPLWRGSVARFRETRARLDLRRRSAGRDASGDLLRCRGRGRRCQPAAGRPPAPGPHPGRRRRLPGAFRGRGRPVRRTAEPVGAPDRAQRRAAGPEEGRHLPDRARRAGAVPAARRARARHRRNACAAWSSANCSMPASAATCSKRCTS